VIDRLELACGRAPWLLRLQVVVMIFTASLLLTADTPVVWRLGSFVLLVSVIMLERLTGRRKSVSGRMILDRDGNVDFQSSDGRIAGKLSGVPWISPWICILHWSPLSGGSRRHSLVCRSLNRPDDFRRLRVWLRLAPGKGIGANV